VAEKVTLSSFTTKLYLPLFGFAVICSGFINQRKKETVYNHNMTVNYILQAICKVQNYKWTKHEFIHLLAATFKDLRIKNSKKS